MDYCTYYCDDFIFVDGKGFNKYMWWGLQRDDSSRDFIAMGNHGQFIYVSPDKKLVILRFGESYDEFGEAQGLVEMFFQFASER